MAKSQQKFNKAEKEKNRLKKRKDKQQKQEERKANAGSTSFEDMIAYVDEFGNITDTPPDPTKKLKVDAASIEISVPKRVEEEIDAVHTGKVAFYNNSKGYGFIKDLANQEQYFFHVNGLIDEVQENDKVSFELEKGMKGLNAVKVQKI